MKRSVTFCQLKKGSSILFVFMFMVVNGYGQIQIPITTITYSPAFPTWEDTVVFICTTESIVEPGSLHSEELEVNGTNIQSRVCYSQSQWLQLGTHIDSVSVVLPFGQSGQYSFSYTFGNLSPQDSCMYAFPIPTPSDTTIIGGMVMFEVQNPNGIESAKVESFKMFPNPTTGVVVLEFSELMDEVWVTDLLGRSLQPLSRSGNHWTTDISKLQDGIYLIQAVGNNRVRTTLKLMKRQ